MKIILMFSVFFSLTRHFAAARNFISPNQILQEILTATKPRDVKFITQDFLHNKDAIVTEIYKTVSQRILTSCIGLNDSIPTELPSIRSSSASLIVYVFISKNAPNSLETENIVRVIALDLYRPKVLFISMLNTRDNNFELLLKSMWSKHILQVMILDLHVIDEKIIEMTVHQYNPYTKFYSKEPYHPQMEWFPNKIKNLYGYPVKVLIGQSDHNNLALNSKGDKVVYSGPDAEVLKIIKRLLNFTILICNATKVPPNLLRSKNIVINVAEAFKYAECEMLMTTASRIEYTTDDLLEYTLPVIFDDFCAVTPIIYERKGIEFQHFMGIALLMVLVGIFWMLSILLKFDKNVWQPLNIFGALLSIAFIGNPTRQMERLAFLAVFFISYIHASNLYADLTTMNIESKVEKEYKSFQELYDSDIIPVTSEFFYNLIPNAGSEHFPKFKEKTKTMRYMKGCIDQLLRYKNVSCIISKMKAMQYIRTYAYYGTQNVKINSNLCFWRIPNSYIFRKGSPYFEKINDIQLRIEASGIRPKWYQRHINSVPLKKNITENVDSHGSSLHWNLLYIAACGYVLSLLAFLGEVVIHSTKKKKIQREGERKRTRRLRLKPGLITSRN